MERDIMQNENVFKFQKKKNQVVVTTTTNNIRNCRYMYKALPKSLFYLFLKMFEPHGKSVDIY